MALLVLKHENGGELNQLPAVANSLAFFLKHYQSKLSDSVLFQILHLQHYQAAQFQYNQAVLSLPLLYLVLFMKILITIHL